MPAVETVPTFTVVYESWDERRRAWVTRRISTTSRERAEETAARVGRPGSRFTRNARLIDPYPTTTEASR